MPYPSVTIGIVSYNDKKYLEKNLPELLRLEYPDYEILIFDNNPTNEIKSWLSQAYPQIKTFSLGQNVGFGIAHNYLIDQAKGTLYLGFNSDMLPHKDFLNKLVEAILADEKIGCVTGKLLQWRNFPGNPKLQPQSYIDTTGLVITKGHHVFDRGQCEPDQGQYEKKEEIWGASGAAPLFRISALKDIAHSTGEYFDRDFFIYKEDIDLSYRLRWAGWQTIYTPEAVAWHDRTTSEMGSIIQTIRKRKERSRIVKEKSFLNQLLFVYKNSSNAYSYKTKLKTALFHLQYIVYALLFEPYLLKQLSTYKKLKPIMAEKRNKMPLRIRPEDMEKWFL